MTTLVYLDTNTYCRPLDDQSDSRIRAEARAFMQIVEASDEGKVEIVTSNYVKFEIEQIREQQKRKDVRGFETNVAKISVASNKHIVDLAREFTSKCKLNALDALHLAAACSGNAAFFITCDDEILRKRSCIVAVASENAHKLRVSNPIMYVRAKRRARK